MIMLQYIIMPLNPVTFFLSLFFFSSAFYYFRITLTSS